jgi:hypothetical protein
LKKPIGAAAFVRGHFYNFLWGDALDWANGLLSAPAANTSEAHLAKVRDAEIGKAA